MPEKKFEDGWYVACPRCHSINKGEGWEALMVEHKTVTVRIDDSEIEYVDKDSGDVELTSIMHSCGFYSEVYDIDEFMVRIENDQIVEVTNYWDEFKDELLKLADVNDLTVDFEVIKDYVIDNL